MFKDYADLRVRVSEQFGDKAISDVLDGFTLAAEAWINREIRCREMVTDASVTFASGLAPLPTDFLEVDALYDASNVPMAVAARNFTKGSTQGNLYSVNGSNLFVTGATGTKTLTYYQKVPTLTTSSTTSNWLLQKSPLLYLYLLTYEVAKWAKDVEQAAAMQSLIEIEHNSLKWADVRGRYGSSIVTTAGYGI